MVNLGEASATYYNASTTTSSIRQSNGTPSHEVTISEDIGSPRQSNAVDLPEIANNRRTHECIFICCKCIYWRPKCCFFKPPKGCVEWLLFLWVVIGSFGLLAWILSWLMIMLGLWRVCSAMTSVLDSLISRRYCYAHSMVVRTNLCSS